MRKNQVFTIGDALITLNPNKTGPLRNVHTFERSVGGAELNFAIGCARLGLPVKWMSRLGNDEFGKYIYKTVRSEGIDMNEVKLVDGFPTSLNFKEINEDGSGKTFYYRYQSPLHDLTEKDIAAELFENVAVVHLTGVFLAIIEKNVAIAVKICEMASSLNIPISFDPNIRLKLWTIEDARKAYFSIFPYVNILLTGKDELEMIIESDEFEKFAEQYSIEQLVIKDGANGSKAYVNNKWITAPPFTVNPIDTVGAGDGFDAGFIYSYLNNGSIEASLQFANAIGALVTTVKGDNEGLPELEDVDVFLGNKSIIER